MMRFCFVSNTVLALGLLASLPAGVLAQLQSVDEAERLSKATGRPIFAMAGNKT
jgi:hypothetical protein